MTSSMRRLGSATLAVVRRFSFLTHACGSMLASFGAAVMGGSPELEREDEGDAASHDGEVAEHAHEGRADHAGDEVGGHRGGREGGLGACRLVEDLGVAQVEGV